MISANIPQNFLTGWFCCYNLFTRAVESVGGKKRQPQASEIKKKLSDSRMAFMLVLTVGGFLLFILRDLLPLVLKQ